MAFNDDGTPIGEVAYFSNANGVAYLNGKWLLCDGTTYSQATYTALFNRLGLINGGGTIWTSETSGTASTINAFAYGASTFVYGAAGGGVSTSTNGITWTGRTSNTSSVTRIRPDNAKQSWVCPLNGFGKF